MKEVKEWSCGDCGAQICECVIGRIRQQEDAMVVAKQAIESLDLLNKKLTKEKDLAVAKVKEYKEKAENTLRKDIKDKREAIDQRFNKMVNRDKLI